MKTTLLLTTMLFICNYGFTQNANTTLSNLTLPTAVNQHLLPKNNNTRDLGSASKSWRILYIDSSMYLKDFLFLHSKGLRNAFVGEKAGNAVTTGTDNSAFGYHALFKNTVGNSNTSIGANSITLVVDGKSADSKQMILSK
ncbi:MAG: hypothetical protein ABI405_09725 [Parafilimonas sp.]